MDLGRTGVGTVLFRAQRILVKMTTGSASTLLDKGGRYYFVPFAADYHTAVGSQ